MLKLLALRTGTPRIATDRYGFIRGVSPAVGPTPKSSVKSGKLSAKAAAESVPEKASSSESSGRAGSGREAGSSGRGLPPRSPAVKLSQTPERISDWRADGTEDLKQAVRRLRKWRKMLGAPTLLACCEDAAILRCCPLQSGNLLACHLCALQIVVFESVLLEV